MQFNLTYTVILDDVFAISRQLYKIFLTTKQPVPISEIELFKNVTFENVFLSHNSGITK